jgi:hypothetical protein
MALYKKSFLFLTAGKQCQITDKIISEKIPETFPEQIYGMVNTIMICYKDIIY